MLSSQGSLDALCGVYATINAMGLAGLSAEREALFETAIKATVGKPWPRPLLMGTTYADLKRIIRSCVDSPANRLGVKARYPLRGRTAATNADFWSIFDSAFEAEDAVCAIVGLSQPAMHWVVAVPDGGRIAFFDSTPEQPYYRKNRASLYAGFRRPKPTHWLLDRRELVVFHA